MGLHKHWKIRKWIALLMVVALAALAGCGGSGQTEEAGEAANPASSSGSAAGTEAGTSAAASGGGREKIVRVTGSFPLRTDPHVSYNGVELCFLWNVYDSLVFSNAEGGIEPHLAESYEMAEDGMTYTFHLRQGIRFHNGDEMKASDVVFSFNRLMAMGEGYAYLFVDYVDNFEAVDDYTVRVNMKKTYGPFLATLQLIPVLSEAVVRENMGSGDYGEFGDYASSWLMQNDAGSGPYTITEVRPDESVLTKKFDDYFLGWGENNPDFFQLIAVNDAATVRTLFSNQELEITDEWQSIETLNALGAMEGVTVASLDTGKTLTLEMNTKIAPTDCEYYRKALAYLFDYQSCIDQIYPGSIQLHGQISPAYKGYSDQLFQYSYNMEKAMEELAKSKYADTYQDYSIDIQWSDSVDDEEKVCLLFQQTLAQVGIKLNILSTPWATMSANAASIETTPHLSVCLPCADYDDAGGFLFTRYHSSASGSSQTYEWLLDTTFDKMIETALSEPDETARLEQYLDCQEYIIEKCPTIFCNTFMERRAYQSGYLYWPEAELVAQGKSNAILAGRSVYARTMQFLD